MPKTKYARRKMPASYKGKSSRKKMPGYKKKRMSK